MNVLAKEVGVGREEAPPKRSSLSLFYNRFMSNVNEMAYVLVNEVTDDICFWFSPITLCGGKIAINPKTATFLAINGCQWINSAFHVPDLVTQVSTIKSP